MAHAPFTGPGARVGRRDALKLGGLTVSLAALVAACGQDRGGSEEGGRVGYQPPITDPPDYGVDDAVLLRTIASVEITIADALSEMIENADADVAPLIEAFIANHRRIADEANGFAVAAGGEAWECGNTWMIDRLIDPLHESVAGSDDAARDLFNIAVALENLAAATNQAYASRLGEADAAAAVLAAAVLESRQSAALVATVRGSDGYFSPVIDGGEPAVDDSGVPLPFALTSRFGSTGQIELVAGAPDENGARTTYTLQTPADNAYVYNELAASC